jgi:dolichyl-phosphate beta-glucosyltransferase
MQEPLPEVSLIIPAYNEEKRIGPSLHEVVQFMSTYAQPMEVLIVDDGSRDTTASVVQSFIDSPEGGARFQYLQYGSNRGKGYAVAEGLRHGTGKYLVFTDTDLSAPIDQLPRLIEGLEAGADIAIASRRLPQSEVVGLPFSRHVMGSLFARLSRLVVLPGISDTQCGFKAYRREAARKLVEAQKIDGYTFDVEHLVLARQFGMKVVEVPVRWVFSEGSQIHGIRDSIRMFRDLLTIPKLHPKN